VCRGRNLYVMLDGTLGAKDGAERAYMDVFTAFPASVT
jgi:hypothetical protein